MDCLFVNIVTVVVVLFLRWRTRFVRFETFSREFFNNLKILAVIRNVTLKKKKRKMHEYKKLTIFLSYVTQTLAWTIMFLLGEA